MEATTFKLSQSTLETLEGNQFQQDTLSLTSYLPEEVWILVAKKLLKFDKRSYENLAHSSEFFRKLLAPQITTVKFCEVLALVCLTVWKKEGLEGLPISDILKCRVVCSTWNMFVDLLINDFFKCLGRKYLNNQLFRNVGKSFRSVVRRVKFLNSDSNIFHVSLNESLIRFLKHFERTHPGNTIKGRSPLIWNTFSIHVHCPDELEAGQDEIQNYNLNLNAIISLLSKHGSSIQKFSLRLYRHEFDNNAALFQSWLVQMPNLTKLKVSTDIEYLLKDSIINVDLNEEDHPLPKLKKLQTLDFDGVPELLANKLIYQNSQISTLVIKFWEGNFDFVEYSLPHLETFRIDFRSVHFFQKLCLPSVNWALKSLTIFENNHSPSLPSCKVIFYIIQKKFANTLLYLNLGIAEEEEELKTQLSQDLKNCRLDLPKLKKIDLFFGEEGLVILDFLLPMTANLEEINVSIGYKFGEVPKINFKSIVEFMGFERNMLDSNIWTFFKKLKTFKVTQFFGKSLTYSYRRTEWIVKHKALNKIL